MSTRREFLHKAAVGGIGSIVASSAAPAFIRNLSLTKTGVSLQEARDVHDRCLIFDAHNDTPVEHVARGMNVSNMMQRDMNYQTDFPRMQSSGYDSAAFIVGNGRIANVWVTMEQTLSTIRNNPDSLTLALKPEHIPQAREEGKIAVLMAIEGIAKWIHGETDIVRMLHRNGVRMIALTHGEGGPQPPLEESSNPFYKRMRSGDMMLQGSRSPYTMCTPKEREAELRNSIGLTRFGEQVLDVNNELGIVTDLAHINDRAYYDVLERTNRPVVVSHTAVFSLCNHFRCLTDDQIRALAENGGVMGVVFYSRFLDEDVESANLETLMRHLAYVADLVGVDHVGFGTDFDGVGTQPLVLPEVSQILKVTQAMMDFGFSEEEIMKMWGGNNMRVLRENADSV